MKILFDTHDLSFQNYGGQEVQIEQTKSHLEKLGVEVGAFNKFDNDILEYDIYHLFGSNSIQHLNLVRYIKQMNLPIVLSPIYWNSFEQQIKTTANYLRKSVIFLKEFQKYTEKFLNYNISLINPTHFYLKSASIVLPNSELESKHLLQNFKFEEKKLNVIHNGVEKKYLYADEDVFINKYGISDFLLFVGRIEPKKNTLSLINSVKNSEHQLILIGDVGDKKYYELCKKCAGKNVTFLGKMEHDSETLKSAYHCAKSFVLPSWLETPGISALEAGLAGCNIVITDRGATKEYFKNMVNYCDPSDINSIRKSIEKAMNTEKSKKLSKHILKNFTWEQIAKNLLELYSNII